MKSCTILLIEDDRDDAEILEEAFSKIGIDRIQHEYSITDAMSYLEQCTADSLPKVILTSLYLGGASATGFIEELQTKESLRQIPVIIVSSQVSPTRVESFKMLGAHDYYAKPSKYEDYLEFAKQIAPLVGSWRQSDNSGQQLQVG